MTPARRLTLGDRRLPVALLVALGLGISGCGGSQVEYQEVPGDPAEINLPERTPAAADDSAEDDATAEETATPAPTETPAAEGATGAVTEEAPDQTAAAEETPAATEDSATTDEPPAPGSDAERFEDFCEQNAGAC